MDKEMMVPLLAALFSGAVSWIARPFFGGYIPKKGENLATKQDIAEITRKIEAAKIEYVAQGEQIRAEIHALTHERQIKFSRLHDKRAEAIDGLYKRLVRTHGRFLPLAGGIVSAEDGNFGTRLEKAGSSARNLVLYFADHRLYFDQALIEQFEQLEQVLNGAWMTFALETVLSRYKSKSDNWLRTSSSLGLYSGAVSTCWSGTFSNGQTLSICNRV